MVLGITKGIFGGRRVSTERHISIDGGLIDNYGRFPAFCNGYWFIYLTENQITFIYLT
jgi:hypothetical protein